MSVWGCLHRFSPGMIPSTRTPTDDENEAKPDARSSHPRRDRETVTVLAMAPEEECEHEMFVRIQWQGRAFGVPLIQLEAKRADARTRQGIDDWRYWVGQGYTF